MTINRSWSFCGRPHNFFRLEAPIFDIHQQSNKCQMTSIIHQTTKYYCQYFLYMFLQIILHVTFWHVAT